MTFLKNLLTTYKLNLLLSLTLGIVIIALRIEENPLNTLLIFLGTFIGTFILELDYFINAYIYDPHSHFAIQLKELINQKNYAGVITHIKTNRFTEMEKILHGAFFQVIVGLIALFLSVPSQNPLGLALVTSVFIQTFYKMYEEYEKHHSLTHWFWILKKKPSKLDQSIYTVAMIVLLGYIFFSLS